MKYSNATKNMLQYIKDNKISTVQLENDTGINVNNIEKENLSLQAEDFLKLCAYLNLSPQDIR